MKDMAQLLRDLSTDFQDVSSQLRQVIINTHSTVFIREMNRRCLYDPCLIIAFAQSVKSVVELDGERKVVQITKINPVPKDDMLQTYIPFSDQERKLSYQMIHDFLDGVSESC